VSFLNEMSCCVLAEKRLPAAPPVDAGPKDAMSALVDQLHCGFQLRPTALGNVIRGRDSIPGQRPATYSGFSLSSILLTVAKYYMLQGRETVNRNTACHVSNTHC